MLTPFIYPLLVGGMSDTSEAENLVIDLKVEVYAKNILWACVVECSFNPQAKRVEDYDIVSFEQAGHEADEFAPMIAYALEHMKQDCVKRLVQSKGYQLYQDLGDEIYREVGKTDLADRCIVEIYGQVGYWAAKADLEARHSGDGDDLYYN